MSWSGVLTTARRMMFHTKGRRGEKLLDATLLHHAEAKLMCTEKDCRQTF